MVVVLKKQENVEKLLFMLGFYGIITQKAIRCYALIVTGLNGMKIKNGDISSSMGRYCECPDCDYNPEKHNTTKSAENPKDAIGSNKIPVHMFPQAAVYMGALGNLDGALKYGRQNWRAADIQYTVYLDAIKRHADALLECEDTDPESGLHHLCHILATAGIIADALANDTIIDDRNYTPEVGAWRKFVAALTPHVKRLKDLHKDKAPRHYTCEDNAE
jgi:hypothetical protein